MSFSEPDRPSSAEFPSGNPPAGAGEPVSDLPKTSISDRRLIDYLMGEPVAASADADWETWRDEQIERWLAQDIANLERLEGLAVAIVGLASEVGQSERRRSADRAEVLGPVRLGSLAGSGRPSRGGRRGWLFAGACSAACLAALLWSLGGNSKDEATGRVAMAWSEFNAGEFNSGETDVPVSLSAAGEWESGWGSVADAEDFTDAVAESGDEVGFAAGGDSPPDWLVFAVARLDDSTSPVELDEDSTR